ncbi:MAG: tRNA (N6-isopentenyl adenosine(37)-C2)-methylthiotransferase MiaB [Planctomycetaceae bacterium]|nr:tRNA (N6-isopentenyl adenosine(37)-C2)-methylthiotransferase MiaB [Planctomycetaceae bacterium]
MSGKFYIETVGCQMNVLDSELAMSELVKAGYTPAVSKRNADVILFNTCSVRQHAEDKVYSAIGRLKHWKESKPDGILGVMGCMAQKDQDIIFRRAPHVDLVIGPGQLHRLADAVLSIAEDRKPRLEVSLNRIRRPQDEVKASFEQYDPQRFAPMRDNPFQAMVRIMFGCNKFCSYCIVPNVRGPEQSRSPAEIEAEIRQLAEQGCVEMTLIGQTVNSYRFEDAGKILTLADLLERIHPIEKIRRIRFVTSYPVGMDDRLLGTIRDLPKVMPFIHIPAQSGSDTVLQRMRRHYTIEEYRRLIDRIKTAIPGVAVTSDFIVGFCGETDREFEETMSLVKDCRFKNSFIFKYSTRPGTKAAELYPDDVPETVKKERNNRLLELQNGISAELNREFVGKKVEILVEGISKNAVKNLIRIGSGAAETASEETVQLTGRTPCDRIVVFDGPPRLAGRIITVNVVETAPFTLFGEREPQ